MRDECGLQQGRATGPSGAAGTSSTGAAGTTRVAALFTASRYGEKGETSGGLLPAATSPLTGGVDKARASVRFLPMSSGEFLKEHHERVKNYIVSLAVVVGGIWTYFLFISLHQVEKAQAELANLLQYPVANIELSASELQLPAGYGDAARVTAAVENTGRRETHLDFGSGPVLSVARVVVDQHGEVRFEAPRNFPVYAVSDRKDTVLALPAADLLPGERTRFEFVVPASKGGLYLLQFAVPVRTGDYPRAGWSWVARSLCVLRPKPRRPDP